MGLGEKARKILEDGAVKMRVSRGGIAQQVTFTVKRVAFGNISYVELFSDRVIDISEITRVAEETGLPVEAANAKAFPEGKSSIDFKDV